MQRKCHKVRAGLPLSNSMDNQVLNEHPAVSFKQKVEEVAEISWQPSLRSVTTHGSGEGKKQNQSLTTIIDHLSNVISTWFAPDFIWLFMNSFPRDKFHNCLLLTVYFLIQQMSSNRNLPCCMSYFVGINWSKHTEV